MVDEAPPDFDPFRVTAVDPAGPGGAAFWRRLAHDDVVAKPTLRSVFRDLISEERERDWVQGPGVVGPPRSWERPGEIDKALDERTPQFCLRNLHRHEMDAWPNDLYWTFARVRTTPAEAGEDIAASRTGGGQGPPLLGTPSYAEMGDLKRSHQELTLPTSWRDFSWRRGPNAEDDDG